MEVLNGNCWCSLYSMLNGTLLSHNSGCQVSERRLWGCTSFSPGLLNWLCYCRPVQGEGSERESEHWYKIQSFRLWPSSQGQSVHSCSLRRRWPGFGSHSVLLPEDPRHPPSHSLLPLSSVPLLSEVIFSPIMEDSLPLSFFFAPITLAQHAVTNSLCSANFHTFPAMGCQHLFSASSLWQHSPSHQHTQFSTHDSTPHFLSLQPWENGWYMWQS